MSRNYAVVRLFVQLCAATLASLYESDEEPLEINAATIARDETRTLFQGFKSLFAIEDKSRANVSRMYK